MHNVGREGCHTLKFLISRCKEFFTLSHTSSTKNPRKWPLNSKISLPLHIPHLSQPFPLPHVLPYPPKTPHILDHAAYSRAEFIPQILVHIPGDSSNKIQPNFFKMCSLKSSTTYPKFTVKGGLISISMAAALCSGLVQCVIGIIPYFSKFQPLPRWNFCTNSLHHDQRICQDSLWCLQERDLFFNYCCRILFQFNPLISFSVYILSKPSCVYRVLHN